MIILMRMVTLGRCPVMSQLKQLGSISNYWTTTRRRRMNGSFMLTMNVRFASRRISREERCFDCTNADMLIVNRVFTITRKCISTPALSSGCCVRILGVNWLCYPWKSETSCETTHSMRNTNAYCCRRVWNRCLMSSGVPGLSRLEICRDESRFLCCQMSKCCPRWRWEW